MKGGADIDLSYGFDVLNKDLTYVGLSYSFFDEDNSFVNKDILEYNEDENIRNILFEKNFKTSPKHLEYHLFQSICNNKKKVDSDFSDMSYLDRQENKHVYNFKFEFLQELIQDEAVTTYKNNSKIKINCMPHPLSLLFKGLLMENDNDVTLSKLIAEIDSILNGKITPKHALFKSIYDKMNEGSFQISYKKLIEDIFNLFNEQLSFEDYNANLNLIECIKKYVVGKSIRNSDGKIDYEVLINQETDSELFYPKEKVDVTFEDFYEFKNIQDEFNPAYPNLKQLNSDDFE